MGSKDDKNKPKNKKPKRTPAGRGKTYRAPRNIRKLRLEGTELQVLDELTDAILAGRVTLDEVARHVDRSDGPKWNDYEGNPYARKNRGENWYLRGGPKQRGIDQREAISQRVRAIYGKGKQALGTQPSLVIPVERRSKYTRELGGDALVQIDNAYERAQRLAEQVARRQLRLKQINNNKPGKKKPGKPKPKIRIGAGTAAASRTRAEARNAPPVKTYRATTSASTPRLGAPKRGTTIRVKQ